MHLGPLRLLRARAPLAALAALCLVSLPAAAQDLEPRAYALTPKGMSFLVLGYGFSQGGVTADPAIPIEDADIEAHAAFLAYAHSFALFGRSAKVDVVVPYGWISGSATFAGEPRHREVSGFGDPRLRFSLLLLGGPALTLEEYRRHEPDWIVGASVQTSLPLGQYERDKLVNVGTNRFSVKPEIGVAKTIGRFTLELTPSVTLYTANDEFLGDSRREQDPLYAFQGHLIYALRWGPWASVDATYYTGGRTEVDGARNDDRQENTRIGGTLALPLGVHHSIKLYASTGASTRTGTDFDAFGIAYQLRWGAGL